MTAPGSEAARLPAASSNAAAGSVRWLRHIRPHALRRGWLAGWIFGSFAALMLASMVQAVAADSDDTLRMIGGVLAGDRSRVELIGAWHLALTVPLLIAIQMTRLRVSALSTPLAWPLVPLRHAVERATFVVRLAGAAGILGFHVWAHGRLITALCAASLTLLISYLTVGFLRRKLNGFLLLPMLALAFLFWIPYPLLSLDAVGQALLAGTALLAVASLHSRAQTDGFARGRALGDLEEGHMGLEWLDVVNEIPISVLPVANRAEVQPDRNLWLGGVADWWHAARFESASRSYGGVGCMITMVLVALLLASSTIVTIIVLATYFSSRGLALSAAQRYPLSRRQLADVQFVCALTNAGKIAGLLILGALALSLLSLVGPALAPPLTGKGGLLQMLALALVGGPYFHLMRMEELHGETSAVKTGKKKWLSWHISAVFLLAVIAAGAAPVSQSAAAPAVVAGSAVGAQLFLYMVLRWRYAQVDLA